MEVNRGKTSLLPPNIIFEILIISLLGQFGCGLRPKKLSRQLHCRYYGYYVYLGRLDLVTCAAFICTAFIRASFMHLGVGFVYLVEFAVELLAPCDFVVVCARSGDASFRAGHHFKETRRGFLRLCVTLY